MSLLAEIKSLFTTASTYEQKARYLDDKASTMGGNLDWRASVIDLLKLMGADSSMASRARLAKELGYVGPYTGTAEQNQWLREKLIDHLQRS